jgi:hypothetical protein
MGLAFPSRPVPLWPTLRGATRQKKERERSPSAESFNLTPLEFISLPEISPFYKYLFSCLVPRLNRILGVFGG